jgi:CRISPR-associated protein Cas2
MFVVAYDIVDNRTRNKIVTILMYYGLSRIQYSVFAGELSDAIYKMMMDSLFSEILGDDDNITVFSICQKCMKNVKTIKPLPEPKRHYCI